MAMDFREKGFYSSFTPGTPGESRDCRHTNPQSGRDHQMARSPATVVVFHRQPSLAHRLCVLLVFGALLSGCAPSITLKPVELSSLPGDAETSMFRLDRNVPIEFSTGNRRTLKRGTRWQLVGTLKEGHVFEPTDSVFTVEGRHIREAYIVVRDGELVGFFLPVEDAFVAVPEPIPLHVSQ